MSYGKNLTPIDPASPNFKSDLNLTLNTIYLLLTKVCSSESSNVCGLKGTLFATAAQLPSVNVEEGQIAGAKDTNRSYMLINGIWR